MKIYTLVFVALTTVFLYTEYVNAIEVCPEENCIMLENCAIPMLGIDIDCHQQDTMCCSVVKEEFRTHCRHHGGTCMNTCPSSLQHNVIDCPNSEVCCTLI